MTENEAIDILGEFETDKPILEMVYGDCHEQALKIAVKALEEIQQYRSIGTVSECREAMEKQRAKKPKCEYLKSLPNCPNCGEVTLQRENEYGNAVGNYSHCPDRGQAIDWSDIKCLT